MDIIVYNDCKGIGGLIQWINHVTKGYNDIEVNDFSKSWSDGRTFCAILHKYKPHLFSFDLILPYKKIENIEFAFDKAESVWNIERLLDSSDFIQPPDEISVLIYLCSWYKNLK